MFGYIRPVNSELYVKDSELYSAVYCGLCRYGGKNISHLTRWLLNYDFVLLALLRISLSKENICIEKKMCPYKLRKKNCTCANDSYSYVTSAFGLLTYENLLDDIKDSKGIKKSLKSLLKPILKHISKKSDKFPGMKEIIKESIATLEHIEKTMCSSPDKAADSFATMTKEIISYNLSEDAKLIAENCGYHIGRFIYLADALDDLEEDTKNGCYNPFLLYYGNYENAIKALDSIKETLYDSLNAFSNYYALAVDTTPNSIDRLIFNIVELGGRSAVQRITERKIKK